MLRTECVGVVKGKSKTSLNAGSDFHRAVDHHKCHCFPHVSEFQRRQALRVAFIDKSLLFTKSQRDREK